MGITPQIRVYISVDLEGIGGVVRPEQVDPNHPTFEQTRLWATEEVLAVMEGAKQAGAEEFYVKDSHARGINLLWHKFPIDTLLVAGRTRPDRFPLLDRAFTALFLVGYHAKAGASQAILPHTWNEGMRLWLNEEEIGEIGIDAAIAGSYGVPVAFVTGDDATAQEAASLLPGLETVVVKKALTSEGGILYPTEKVLGLLRTGARIALEKLLQGNGPAPYIPQSPYTLRVAQETTSGSPPKISEITEQNIQKAFRTLLGEG